MNSLDARGVLVQAIRQAGWKATKTGKTLAFRCPRHDDSHASAWLGDHQWGCSACGFTEHFDTLADLLRVTLPDEGRQRGLTVAEYAERKGLALATLQKAGVYDAEGRFGDALVAIPYRRGDGTLIRTKFRGRKGTFWGKDGEGAPLYGQDVLAVAPKDVPVLLVEGESDCHAAWERGVVAVGLPGASQWRKEYAALLIGRPVVVWQEPDVGGATLVASVAADLPKARVLRDVKLNEVPVKDFCDLHNGVQELGADWRTTWRAILATATPIGAEPPAVAFDAIAMGDTLDQLLDEKLAPIDAVPTPLEGWNELCRGDGGGVGLARTWVVTVGGNTGTGKSLVGVNLAAAAMRHGENVLYLSLEMSRSELATRLLSVVSSETVGLLEKGSLFDPTAFRRAGDAMRRVQMETGGQVYINRAPISRLTDVVRAISYHVEYHAVRYVVVDYLQLVTVDGVHELVARMEQVSHTLREVAAKQQVVLVQLSQFNRQTSANRAERPVAQGLMGGSALENDSHIVALLDHSRFERAGNIADTWLLIDKNRNGSVRDLPMRWDYRTLTMLPRPMTLGESDKAATKGRKKT